ncbi:MAG: ComF family protein [Bacteroidetes bacterium]|nr:ComF family protein [Bacteroidota bacterium]
MKSKDLIRDFISLLYPRLCFACGNSLFKHEQVLCTHCLFDLPRTNFHLQPDNPLDKVFWGRVPVKKTAALFYFTKGGKVQHLVHQLKYKGRKEVGIYTGIILGAELKKTPSFDGIDLIIPVPLHPRKQKKRGYNQSEQFAIGLSESTGIEMDIKSFVRTIATETQTRKSRFARFENVKEIFKVTNPLALENKHLLLVDDVITTGSTLESCANILLQIPGVSISMASIAYAVG